MVRARRTKRASATDLYRTCKASGTCPPDVVNKIEGTTIADKILQYGSMGVFFGGLGIGTGKGTGGATGYVPLRPGGGTSSLGPTIRPRPPLITLEESILAGDPSIVPLQEGGSGRGDIPLELIPTITDAGSNVTVTPDVPVLTTSSTDVVVHGEEPPPAVLDLSPMPGNGSRSRVAQSQFHNPLFHEGQGDDVFIGESTHGWHTVIRSGGHRPPPPVEEIPLQDLGPGTSTPLETSVRGYRALRLYGRDTAQVRVLNDDFLGAPRRLVAFDNPAFEGDETLAFDPEEAAEAHDPDFLDIVRLHRPAFTTRRGSVRVSRIGSRLGTVQTRRGTGVGARVHFFRDISPIPGEGEEDIELTTFSGPGGEGDYTVSRVSQGTPFGGGDVSSHHVTISGSTILVDVPPPSLPPMWAVPPTVPLPSPADGPFPDIVPVRPGVGLVDNAFMFAWGPQYILRRRKRKRPLPPLFADGFVAA